MTTWGAHLLAHPDEQPLPEYPRPNLVRDSYLNLNGWWDYAITSSSALPSVYEGQIRVPFSPESVLSGVSRTLHPHEFLVYRKEVKLPAHFRKDILSLHFGAVDQYATVYVDQQLIGTHLGGYTPFTLQIHPEKDTFELVVMVQDVSNQLGHLSGKQRINRGGIFYTPQSGIWQTVWMESVSTNYIQKWRITPDLDHSSFRFEWYKEGHEPVEIIAYFENHEVGRVTSATSTAILPLTVVHPWSPDHPNLYHFSIVSGKDNFMSYAGLRKVERKQDASGQMRFYLNNQPIFQSGVLDQGYYSDGLLTPPHDEAMLDDIQLMKTMGFNMIRKHIKLEPLRWYYHCDKVGMLAWQDMVSGTEWENVTFHHALSLLHIHLPDGVRRLYGRTRKSGRQEYEVGLREMLETLHSYSCIVVWVPFNEAWGQFDTRRIIHKIHQYDPSRLIDHASGWSDQGIGDFCSRHIYFTSIKFSNRTGKRRINALTEFGGYSYPVKGHRYNPDYEFGYRRFENQDTFEAAVMSLFRESVLPQLHHGLSVLVYTQLSDVEDEINGLITYDRQQVKISSEFMRMINTQLFDSFESIK